jgi:hypothetical protein
MLYDSVASSAPFSASLAIFEEHKPKWLSMNNLQVKLSFSNKAQSTLIKPNQEII